MTAQRRVADISMHVETQFSHICNKCVYWLLMKQRTFSTAETCIFARDVTSEFEVFQELVNVNSVQGQTEVLNFILPLQCRLQKVNLELSKLLGMVTDAVPFMIGCKHGTVPLPCFPY
jgi:hypothetical protein